MMKCPESWIELKAELEAAGMSADVIQGAAVGWSLAERATPTRYKVMATDRTEFIAYQSVVEASAGSSMETLAIWKRLRNGKEATGDVWSIEAYDSLSSDERVGLQHRACGFLNAWKYRGCDDWKLDGEWVRSDVGGLSGWWYEAMDEAAKTRRQGLSWAKPGP